MLMTDRNRETARLPSATPLPAFNMKVWAGGFAPRPSRRFALIGEAPAGFMGYARLQMRSTLASVEAGL